MKESGVRITCDRCKRTIFSKTINPNPDITATEMLEPGKFLSNIINIVANVKHIPEEDGWKEHDGFDFCPKCAEEYRNLVGKFLGETVGDKEE